jgi:hypothetical protein
MNTQSVADVDTLTEDVTAELVDVLLRLDELNRHKRCSVEMMLVPRGISRASRQRPVKPNICMICSLDASWPRMLLELSKGSRLTLSPVSHERQLVTCEVGLS